MLTIDEKNACFDGDTSLHAHFLCKKCGKIFDLPYSNEVKKSRANWYEWIQSGWNSPIL